MSSHENLFCFHYYFYYYFYGDDELTCGDNVPSCCVT